MNASAEAVEFALSFGGRFTPIDESILLEQPGGFWAAVLKANKARCDKQETGEANGDD